MPVLTVDSHWQPGTVRVRASAADPLAGKNGHDYIVARKLNAPAQRLDPDAAEREQAIRNIIAAETRRYYAWRLADGKPHLRTI